MSSLRLTLHTNLHTALLRGPALNFLRYTAQIPRASFSTSTAITPSSRVIQALPRRLRRSIQFGHASSSSHNLRPLSSLSHLHRRHLSTPPPPSSPQPPSSSSPPSTNPEPLELRESPYTLPNALTSLRMLACPLLGYYIVKGEMEWATGLLVLCGVSDWLDGWIARKFNMASVFGTILDPAADKALMTTLTCTLAYSGLLPIPLAILILARDIGLSLSAFYYRYISLPEPKTFKRYWDFGIPSAEVKPTTISKYNTALQLLLMGVTTVSPLLSFDISLPLQALQWTVAGTTIWSGWSYVGRKGVNILVKPKGPSATGPGAGGGAPKV